MIVSLERFEEAKSLLRRTMPVARRVLGESDSTTLRMRWNYAVALYRDPDASLDDIREAVETIEEAERAARRVLGGGHPTAMGMEQSLRHARAVLSDRAKKEKLMEELDVTAEVFDKVARFATKTHRVSVLGTTVEATYGDLESTRKALEALPPGDA